MKMLNFVCEQNFQLNFSFQPLKIDEEKSTCKKSDLLILLEKLFLCILRFNSTCFHYDNLANFN